MTLHVCSYCSTTGSEQDLDRHYRYGCRAKGYLDELVKARADILVLRTALQKEYERHRRAVTIGDVPIEWCAACTKKRYPCAVREELGVVLGGGDDGLPANPEFDIDNDDGSF